MKLNNCISIKQLTTHILMQMVFMIMMFASAGAEASAASATSGAVGVAAPGLAFSAPAATSPSSTGVPATTSGSLTFTPVGEAIVPGTSQLSAPMVQTPEGALPAQQSPLQQSINPASAPVPGSQSTVSKSVPDPSAIEVAMLASGKESEKTSPQAFQYGKLQQFGYSFFRTGADPFAAMSDIPVGPDYVLGTGDRINLTVWGSIDGSYPLEVSREGEIVIPKVGPVKVAGVTFGQLPQLLSGQLSRIFRNFQLSITMGKLRMIKVYVVGEVNAPGDYTVSSMSTLLNALSSAGGPTRNGSLRTVAIRRDGRLVDTVDLYDFFLKGDKSRDIRLQPGDTVFVPSIGPVAGIVGNVRRPAIFELKNEKTLNDLLALADGIVPTGYLQRIQISRVDAYDKKRVTDVSLDP